MRMHRSAASIVVWAPAKISLLSEILARRGDGFHEIETLMVPINLYDTLEWRSAAAGPIEFCCQWAAGGRGATDSGWESVPRGAENLVVRAVELPRARAGVRRGASIRLVKRIPAASGLGGGSSDAAAALVAANVGWQLDWPVQRLEELGAELGSDIPYFVSLLGGRLAGAAICRGRGERIDPVGRLVSLHAVLVRPPLGLATAEVYRGCRPAEEPLRAGPLLESLGRGRLAEAARRMHNALQPAAERLSDWIGRLRAEFNRLDFLGHQLSGSGTGYFGLCRHRRQASRLAARLRSRRLGTVYVVRTAN